MSGCDSGEGSSQSGPSQFEWELCRENVKPLKSGRRVEAVNQVGFFFSYFRYQVVCSEMF